MKGEGAGLWIGACAVAIMIHVVFVGQVLGMIATPRATVDAVTLPAVEIVAAPSGSAAKTAEVVVASKAPTQRLNARETVAASSAIAAGHAARTVAPNVAPVAAMAANRPKVAGLAAPAAIATAPRVLSQMPGPVGPDAPVVRPEVSSAPVTPRGSALPVSVSRAALFSRASVASIGPVDAAPILRSARDAPSAALPVAVVRPVPSVAHAAEPGAIAPLPQSGRGASGVRVTDLRIAAIVSPKSVRAQAVLPAVQVTGFAPVPSPKAASPALSPVAAPQNGGNGETYPSALDFLAGAVRSPCFAAVPTDLDRGFFALDAFARDGADVDRLDAALQDSHVTIPKMEMKPITPAQCAAVDFVGGASDYPRFNLKIDLSNSDIASGDAVEGRIGSVAGVLSLYMVDDEGLVQDVSSYLKTEADGAAFKIAVKLTGGPVKTQQLLIALATPGTLKTMPDPKGTQAAIFFPRLTAELAMMGIGADTAIAAFTVR